MNFLENALSTTKFKVQAVAKMLGTTVDTVRRDVESSGIDVERQAGEGPKTRLFSIDNIYELARWRAQKNNVKAKKQVILTVYAPKGGVGKTTNASNLACLLPMLGLSVLVVDLDFQANLTMSYNYDSEMTHEEAIEMGIPESSCVDYHFGNLLPQWYNGQTAQAPTLEDVLKKPFGEFGPHLIPAEVNLDRLEALFTLDSITGKHPEFTIAKFIHDGRNGKNPKADLSKYDVIIFDAPPAKNQSTKGALLASDYVIAPVSMEKYSTKSISYLSKVLNEMKEDAGRFPELMILGNFYDKTRLRVAAQVMTFIEKYPNAWIKETISTSEDFKRSASMSDDELPLSIGRPNSNSADELRKVASAIVAKMGVL